MCDPIEKDANKRMEMHRGMIHQSMTLYVVLALLLGAPGAMAQLGAPSNACTVAGKFPFPLCDKANFFEIPSDFADSDAKVSFMSYGVTTGDFDKDGFADLFISSPGSAPNKLLFNYNGNGFKKDVRGTQDIEMHGHKEGEAIYADWRSIAFDADNDDDIDILVCRFGTSRMWLNDGTGRFNETASSLDGVFDGVNCREAVTLDYDGDGYDDILIASQGTPSKLYQNSGRGDGE